MAKSSINVQPVKMTSERHNRREMKLDYVREDLAHLNQSKELDSIKNRFAEIKARYEKTVGQKMQKKATPIREAVFLIKPETTLEDCIQVAGKLNKRFGIGVFQVHMHKDEGHYDENKEWKPNLHAHLVMDWTDQETGKSLKLNKQDMAEMQTIVAETLGMERGQSSEKKHLSSLQYKNSAQAEMNIGLETKLSDLKALNGNEERESREKIERLRNAIKNAAEKGNETIRWANRVREENLKLIQNIKTIRGNDEKWVEETRLKVERLKVNEAALAKIEENIQEIQKVTKDLSQEVNKTPQEPKKDLPKKGGGISL